ncbi:DUF4346 domain-containing protein [Candidatus Woesearchaeota archaeon]|nr:DUF4346 domain-containing protein [Candidatus Woesearchaeota archaeon]
MQEYEVRIDRNKCIGAGSCEKVAPDIFSVDESNKVALKCAQAGAVSLKIGSDKIKSAVEGARVCPVYAIGVIDKSAGKSILGIEPEKNLEVRKILAHYDSSKEWQMDPFGFFTIKPFPAEGIIKVRYYNAKHQLAAEIAGKTAEEIYNTICREKLVSSLAHSAYLGSELQKAEIAMKRNLPYVQDDPLDFKQS